MLTEDDLAAIRAIVREELGRYQIKRKPPSDITEKRRAAAMAMLARRAAKAAIAEQKAKRRKGNGHADLQANAEQKFTLPEWIPTDQWQAYVQMRVKIGKPLTDWAKGMAVAKLERLKEQGHHPAAVLAQSAFAGWQGLFPIKEQ